MLNRLIVLLLSLPFISIQAQEQTTPETYPAFGETLNYRFYAPKEIPIDKKIPIIVFLHGAGERGDDNLKQIKHGFASIVKYSEEHNQPCFILAPQCPVNKQWANTKWSEMSHDMPEFPSTPMRLMTELLYKKIQELPVDTNRIYITGLSMGGYGTWDIISRKPDFFAAALAVCGGGDTNQAPKLTKLPIWAIHGDNDKAVPVERSRTMIQALKDAGGNPNYTEHAGAGHDVWTRTYSDTKILEWLFAQKKN